MFTKQEIKILFHALNEFAIDEDKHEDLKVFYDSDIVLDELKERFETLRLES